MRKDNPKKQCGTCKHSLKRSDFSFKKYGNYAYTRECLLKEDTFVMASDGSDCKDWQQNPNPNGLNRLFP